MVYFRNENIDSIIVQKYVLYMLICFIVDIYMYSFI